MSPEQVAGESKIKGGKRPFDFFGKGKGCKGKGTPFNFEKKM
jgi:hypothetical protein